RQHAIIAIGPAVIEAAEAAARARPLRADDGAAVPAGVEMAAEVALHSAKENHRAAGHLTRDEIVRFIEFGRMADIDPAFGEDLRHFVAQHGLRDQSLPIQQKAILYGIVDDVTSRHGGSGCIFITVAPAHSRCYGAKTIRAFPYARHG